MVKKILLLVFLSFLISCGSSRKRTSSSKHTASKTRTATPRKRTPVKTTAGNTSGSSSDRASSSNDTEVLESTSRTVVYADIVKKYIQDFKEVAKDNMRRHGIPASITLAQGILESGAGRGTLCVNANNHFGIKCHTGWEGDRVYHDDDTEQECFRKYAKPAESYNDHSLFLTSRSRYAALFKLPKGDYEAWARGLKAAGYATDPKYPEKLIGIIERYELFIYDDEVLGSPNRPVKPIVQAPVKEKEVLAPKEGNAVAAADSHKVQRGETLYSISKKYNITVDKLMQLNGLENNAISIGQILKVK